MNYFKCSVGGSGKGNTVIVTCAEEFAGQTIVLAKIGKRYTKTCPSTSPYEVRFYGVESGTYTVSATVQGQTYSETVVVQDVSCVLNYGFTWKTWVDTAQYLDSTDYASLSEVLADEEAVRELFLEHACVDYMADSGSSNADLETIIDNDLCAKWINNSDYALDFLGANTVIKALMDTADKYGYGEWVITDDTTTPPTWGPKGNVPVMTANNAPYGVASATVETSGHEAYKAFDGDDSTYYDTRTTSSNGELIYKFVNPTCVRRWKFVTADTLENFKNRVSSVSLYGSNDGSTWSNALDTVSTDDLTNILFERSCNNDSYYLQYKIIITKKNSDPIGVATLQFYGCSLSVSVPTMTSNTAPFGEVIRSSYYQSDSGYEGYKAFDDNSNTLWGSSVADAIGAYLGYDFKKLVNIKMLYVMDNNSTNNRPTSITIQGYTGSEWEDIQTISRNTQTTITDINGDAYTKFRVKVNSIGGTAGTNNACISTLQFYGSDYSEKEFEAGTTKKWLYDHGVELESMEMPEYTGNSFVGSTIEKLSSSIKLNVGSNTYGGCGVITSDKINLNAFDLIRMKISEFGSTSSSSNVAISVVSNKTGANPTNIANASFTRGNSNIPYNMSLDISSVNEEDYVLAIVGNAPSFSAEMSELWLE